MNEAVFDEGWESSDLTLGQFKTWHTTVASWIKSRGTYMVAANVKEHAGSPWPCVTNNNVDVSCRLEACNSPSDCPNFFSAHFAAGVDINAFHWGAWEEDICGMDDHALQLGRPVVFDDDGGCHPSGCTHPRNDNTKVRNWALNISDNPVCGQTAKPKGQLHFYHTGDGSKHEGNAPTDCFYPDNRFVDCQVWNGIADAIPDLYCGTALTPCATRVNYCENKTGGCSFP